MTERGLAGARRGDRPTADIGAFGSLASGLSAALPQVIAELTR